MEKADKIKIVLTGGHAATTAIATLEELIRRKERKWDIYWLGTKAAIEGKDFPSLESEAIPSFGVKFHHLTTGRIQRKFTRFTIPSLLKIPFGILHAFQLLLKIQPKIILSFGGFAAFPTVFAAWCLGIPVIIHEQTAAAGRANQASASFARKIAISRVESKKYFPEDKCVVTGNPVLTQISEVSIKEKKGNPATLFVTGGSRGSQTINEALLEVLPEILGKFYLIHQTGHAQFKLFSEMKKKLAENLRRNYEVFDRIAPMQMDNLYRQADIIVARAGANTVSEILITKIPSILIPLPISYLDEQTKNARIAEKFGIAKIIPQADLTPKLLLNSIEELSMNWERMVAGVRNKKSPDILAAGKLVDLVEEILG